MENLEKTRIAGMRYKKEDSVPRSIYFAAGCFYLGVAGLGVIATREFKRMTKESDEPNKDHHEATNYLNQILAQYNPIKREQLDSAKAKVDILYSNGSTRTRDHLELRVKSLDKLSERYDDRSGFENSQVRLSLVNTKQELEDLVVPKETDIAIASVGFLSVVLICYGVSRAARNFYKAFKHQ